MSFQLSSSIIENGDIVEFTASLTNVGRAALTNIVFSDALELGMSLEALNSQVLSYAPISRTVSAAIPVLNPGEVIVLSYSVRVGAIRRPSRPDGEIWVHNVEATGDGIPVTVATISLWAGASESATGTRIGYIPRGGGWVMAGRTRVMIPLGAFPDGGAVFVRAADLPGGPDQQFQVTFRELTEDVTSPEPLSELRLGMGAEVEPVLPEAARLSVSFEGMADLDQLPAGREPYVVTYDEQAKVWVKVPVASIDYAGNRVEVEAAHFSTWGAGIGDSLPQNGANVLLFDQPMTSLQLSTLASGRAGRHGPLAGPVLCQRDRQRGAGRYPGAVGRHGLVAGRNGDRAQDHHRRKWLRLPERIRVVA
jgi:uncharacterized repeat protein (TIGR01451 family)